MKLLAPVISLFAASTAAVDIAIHLGHGCSGNYARCNHIPKDNCCYNAANIGHFGSARFTGLGRHARGGILDSAHNRICGKLAGIREGSGCVNAKGGHASGAAWEPPARGADDGAIDPRRCNASVPADVAVIDGHHFYINYHVPERESFMLSTLLFDNARYEEVPEELKEWEF